MDGDLQKQINESKSAVAAIEETSTASRAYSVGQFFVYNGLLYKCTTAIASGGTITPGTIEIITIYCVYGLTVNR